MATEQGGAAPAAGQTRGPLPGFEGDGAAPPSPSRRFVSTKVEVEGREETKIVELPAFEPEPWGEGATLRHVGARLPRVDALEKVTGRARYTADVARPGMLHAAILRAPLPRGRVTRIDLGPALALPGVRDAVTAADEPASFSRAGVRLFGPEVTYAGQPVAALCADTLDAAERALGAIVVEYERLPFAATFADAVADGAPAVRARGGNTARGPRILERGDVDRGFREADVVLEREYRTPVALHSALEPHGAVAEWEGGRLTLWESTQGIFNTRDEVAAAFALPHTAVRVIKDHMGGGFGAKNGASTNAYVAALLAHRSGRPVRCINDREGEQIDSGNRPATVQRVRIGATRDGRLTVIALEADVPLGVAGWQAGPGKIYHQMYACPNVRTSETFAYVNAGAMASFRAPGHVEGAFGLERAMDVLARTLSIDPLDLRLRNFAERDGEKDRPYSSNRLRECYAAAAARFGWREGERRASSDEREERTTVANTLPHARPSTLDAHPPGSRKRGRGLASQVWNAGGGPPAYALVKLNSDGTADVLSGTQDLGTGSRTILTQVAAEALGAAPSAVRVVIGDTERTPYTGNSWGSMTTPSVAPAVRMAAEDARRQLFEAAAGMLDAAPEALEACDGVIAVRGGERRMSFADVADRLGDVMIIGRGSRGPNPDRTAISTFGVQFAEVEVDVETGVVRVLRIVAAHDAGRVINPTLAESQLEGGILQGLGYALFEERVLDPRLGLPLNPTMHDYKLPTLSDVPAIDAFCVAGADPSNHTGARGLAEAPIIPTAPAIANAVADALGVEIDEIPLTPWRVLQAIEGGTRDATPP